MNRTSIICFAAAFAAIIALSGCKPNDEKTPNASPTSSNGEQNQQAPLISATSTPSPTPSATPTLPASVEVGKSAVKVLNLPETGQNVYGCVELINTASRPIYIKEAKFSFNIEGKSYDNTFTPMLNTDDIIPSNGKINLAYWMPHSAAVDASKISLSVTAEADFLEPRSLVRALDVANVMITDNYPGFSTASGTIHNQTGKDYSLSLIYLSFYDAAENLLATWHFTKNLSIPEGESRNFVVHMQTLPIENLSANTTTIVARGIGID